MSFPYPTQFLVDEGVRAVRIAAGDSIAAVVSAKGDLRVEGTLRVRVISCCTPREESIDYIQSMAGTLDFSGK